MTLMLCLAVVALWIAAITLWLMDAPDVRQTADRVLATAHAENLQPTVAARDESGLRTVA